MLRALSVFRHYNQLVSFLCDLAQTQHRHGQVYIIIFIASSFVYRLVKLAPNICLALYWYAQDGRTRAAITFCAMKNASIGVCVHRLNLCVVQYAHNRHKIRFVPLVKVVYRSSLYEVI